MFEFKRPSDGAVYKWKPITMGQRWACEAAYSQPHNVHLRNPALLAARIIGGPDKDPAVGYDVTKFGAWEEDDYAAFVSAVGDAEAMRSAQFAKKDAGPDPVANLTSTVANFKQAVISAAAAADAMVAAAKASAVPLGG